VIERVLELLLADGERLELADDVREPEPDELDVLLLDPGEDLARVGLSIGGCGSDLHLRSNSFSVVGL
jgi:hypothetical protein